MSKSSNKVTLQAGVIAYRQIAPHWPLQLCLITNRRDRWGFPKGTVRRKEQPAAAAFREAYEEAGISGDVVSGPFAFRQYRRQGRPFSLQIYLMHVTSTADEWPEADSRRRCWVSIRNAFEIIDRAALHEVLEEALDRLKLLVPKAQTFYRQA